MPFCQSRFVEGHEKGRYFSGRKKGWKPRLFGCFKHRQSGLIGFSVGSSKVPSSRRGNIGVLPTNHYHSPHHSSLLYLLLEMFPTRVLFSQSARVTLFTRTGCGLCDTAKHNVVQLNKRRPFDYTELDIMAPANKAWKDVYDYDVPVLHVQSVRDQQAGDAGLSDPKKLFHRFSEQEVEKVVDEVENAN